MLKRVDRLLRNAATHLGEFDQKQISLGPAIKNVVSHSDVQRFRSMGRDRSLVELEAENAELRNAAIELALELRDLRRIRS